MEMKRIVRIIFLLWAGIIISGCSKSIEINNLKISSLLELLEKNNIKIEECYLNDYIDSADVKFDINTKQITFMNLNFAVYKKDSPKYETFTITYKENKLALRKNGYCETKLTTKMADFLNSIADIDFTIFLDPKVLEKAKYIEILTIAYFQNAGNGFDPDISKDMTEYAYRDGFFKKIEKIEKDFPNCAEYTLNVFENDNKAVHETKTVLLYP